MTAPALGWTVRSAMGDVRAALARAGIEEAALEARLLLEEVTGYPWAALLAHPDDRMPPATAERLSSLVSRRVLREPLAYVLGHAQFRGLRLRVDRRVLVPRPETELLAGLAIDRCEPGGRVIDVGTGSGAIALAVAAERRDVSVTAIDLSADALRVTAENARATDLVGRVAVVQADLLSALRPGRYFVLANVPYVPDGELAAAQPELSWEPGLALAGGPDGLDVYRRLLRQAAEVVTGGTVACEIALGQGEFAVEIARQTLPGASVSVLRDYAGINRFVVAAL